MFPGFLRFWGQNGGLRGVGRGSARPALFGFIGWVSVLLAGFRFYWLDLVLLAGFRLGRAALVSTRFGGFFYGWSVR